MPGKSGIPVLLLAALWLSAAGACKRNGASPGRSADPAADAAITVKAAPAAVRDWTVAIAISGSLRSRHVVDVKPEVGGKLLSALAEEGSEVKQGDLLAEIDPTNYRLACDQALAALAVAKAGVTRVQVALDHARREKERADNLVKSGGVTEKDRAAAENGLRDAESQQELAKAQVAQAQAAVAIAEKALEDCRVFAPSDGEVRRKFLDPGALVAPGVPLYTLVDNRRLELEFMVPSYQLAGVRRGQRARFTTPSFGERSFEGTVAAINPMVETDNRSVGVTVRIDNSRGELKAGMFARGEIEVGRQNDVLVVPRTALVAEQDSADSGAVFVVREGKALRRRVRIGGAREDWVWVKEGLNRDELVILELGPSLREGTAVKVAAAAGAGE